MAGHNEDDYVLTDGERVTSTAIGWNFGDGHFSNEQLVAALHKRCHFEPGEVRVVMLDAQPIHRQTQQYRLVDAATGEFERGYVRVADMVTRQPWADDVPVHVDREHLITTKAERHEHMTPGLRYHGYALARTFFVASTRLASDAETSSGLRVFRPQSGLTQSRSAGTAFSASRNDVAISSVLGTRGEWMS